MVVGCFQINFIHMTLHPINHTPHTDIQMFLSIVNLFKTSHTPTHTHTHTTRNTLLHETPFYALVVFFATGCLFYTYNNYKGLALSESRWLIRLASASCLPKCGTAYLGRQGWLIRSIKNLAPSPEKIPKTSLKLRRPYRGTLLVKKGRSNALCGEAVWGLCG